MSDEMKKQLAVLKDNYLAALPGKIAAIRILWTEIKANKNSGALDELHRMAHGLAGSGATYGQVYVSKCAKELENFINERVAENEFFESSKEVDRLLENLENSVNDSKNEVHHDSSTSVRSAVDVGAILESMKVDSMRILLADDDPDIREHIKLFLESRGHTVFEAKNGQEAIDIFDEAMPDLVVMDVVMPGLTGYETTAILKEKSGRKFVPVIFLTSKTDDETLALCIAAGGDDFITKPFNPIMLNAKLQAFQRIGVMHDTLDEYQQKTEEELETSKHVLNSLINNANDDVKGLSCWADSPGHFSGDTRLFKILDNGHVYILLCDFTGHGLPAAIGTVFAADLFRSMTQKGFDAKIILNEINSKMNQILPTGRYCAAIMVDYDPSISKLKIWNAGLPNAYLVDEDFNITDEFASSGVPLGVIGGDAMCEFVEVDISKSRSIIVFSDGVTEAENPLGEMYLEPRLLGCIGDARKGEDIFKLIKEDVEMFMDGTEPTDDISLIVLNF